MGHSYRSEGLTGLRECLQILGQTAMATEDGESSLHNPAEFLHDEAALVLGYADDIEDDAGQELGHPVRELLAAVAPISQDARRVASETRLCSPLSAAPTRPTPNPASSGGR